MIPEYIEAHRRVQEGKSSKLHVGLAPLYGEKLKQKSYKMMDMMLSLAVRATLSTLSRRDSKMMSWEEAVKLMRLNPALEDLRNDVFRQRTLLRRPTVHLRGNNISDPKDEIQLETRFRDLVQDEDVLRDTNLGVQTLGSIIANTDVVINSLRNMIHKTERRSENLLDIGFIRFPDINQPYFRVYRIQLNVWVKRKLALGIIQKDASGIDGRYNLYDFGPCQAILDLVAPQVRSQALMELENQLVAHL